MNDSNAIAVAELDATSFPEFREHVRCADREGTDHEPRTYPGYPRTPLPHQRPRRLTAALDSTLASRRCATELGTEPISPRDLARILQFGHGITGEQDRGPTPSAGGLQGLELYLATLGPSWIPAGVHHYDRRGHHLSRVADAGDRESWQKIVPSLGLTVGGAVLLLLVGDGERAAHRYGARAARFLLLEAGHLMQNLCLLAASRGLVVVPLGGVFERAVAGVLALPDTDVVLYAGLAGSG